MRSAAVRKNTTAKIVPLGKKAPNPTDKHVGGRVRMRRMMLGMSQTKLGDAIGLTFQQVQKYEKGTNRIGASRLAQIAQILQVPVGFFFDGAPGGDLKDAKQASLGAMDPMFEVSQTRDGLALIGAFNAIADSKSRAVVVDIAEILARKERA
ncbi:MAG TPA: helix-turn-helix domain-containing protein [Stellaceae bacterium]|jgi:transcriptional regulator with XRE-family HTH domain|nr:helix-turn-helix domain-containing protein [Stellaceae bacterium]